MALSLGNSLPGVDFSYIFSGENFGENLRKNFPQKCCEKMEFSAESDFPRKKMYEKLAPGGKCLHTYTMMSSRCFRKMFNSGIGTQLKK
jgi:hypothetical protein